MSVVKGADQAGVGMVGWGDVMPCKVGTIVVTARLVDQRFAKKVCAVIVPDVRQNAREQIQH